jgi:hypothetical protein
MGLIYHQAATKDDVVAAARKTWAVLADVPDAAGGASPLAHYFVSDTPLAVYSLGLSGLKKGDNLDDAKAVAWRVFVVDSHNEAVGAAEVAPSGGGEPAHLLSYAQGARVAASGKALSDAEAPMAADSHYEPRFLEIPGINTTALWLKNLGEGKDQLVPIDPVPRFLRDQKAYSPDEFLDRVRLQAAKRLKFDDKPTQADSENEPPQMPGSAGA